MKLSEMKCKIIYKYRIDLVFRIKCPILIEFEYEKWKLFAKRKTFHFNGYVSNAFNISKKNY